MADQDREQYLMWLLEDALVILRQRGTYFYNSERRGPAAELVEKIEREIERYKDRR